MDAQLRELILTVIESADDTSCTDDLTVASKSAIDALADWLWDYEKPGRTDSDD